MKVAIVTSFPPSKVTLNEYGYHLAKNFVNKEDIDELVLLTDKTKAPKQLDFENSDNVKVNECWSFNSYKTIVSIFRAVLSEKPDVILFNLQFVKFGDKKIPAALGLLLPMLLRFVGFKTIVLLHNIMETVDLKQAGFSNNKIAQKIYSFIGSSITRCILKANIVAVTINKYVEILNAKYKADNVVLVPHGSFETVKSPNFTLSKGPYRIMAFGKFGTYKKVEVMIEAAKILRAQGMKNIEVIIAGTDSPNTPGYLESVRQKYNDVEGLVFTGYVEEHDVERIFTESTVVVFPYTATTGSSGVLHQAGSYGKAVVMPDIGDLALLVKDEGYKGEFFNPDNTASLALAIGRILNNDDYRKELAMANYNAAQALSMDKITDMYLQHFKTLQPVKKSKEKLIGNI
ncbi:MAG: glycosyl transferase family 1 [Flavobacterium sp. MedPE-SWcel]|uniref:glycosyltransferase n=1 Tax=uncultured Flavobacterium sp. TaxID=165435 RepID=UPI00091E8189|nr:glycosyltransferase [uncultured Flavobacterium sp.]OIQ20163.1 MAG: glycosyl transferase family 1 [Flavobacterium sp. MedPE-SWcel]